MEAYNCYNNNSAGFQEQNSCVIQRWIYSLNNMKLLSHKQIVDKAESQKGFSKRVTLLFLYKQPGITCPKFKQILGLSCNCDKQLYSEMPKYKQLWVCQFWMFCSFPFEVLSIENKDQQKNCLQK